MSNSLSATKNDPEEYYNFCLQIIICKAIEIIEVKISDQIERNYKIDKLVHSQNSQLLGTEGIDS